MNGLPTWAVIAHLWHVKGLIAVVALASGIIFMLGIAQVTVAVRYMGELKKSLGNYAHLQTGRAMVAIFVLA